MKKTIRRFASWLYYTTNSWVIDKKLIKTVSDREFDSAYLYLAEAEDRWGLDPEITRVRTMVSFLQGDN